MLSSCVNDKPASNSESETLEKNKLEPKANRSQDAKTPPAGVTKGETSTSTLSRPTENIKVNLPGSNATSAKKPNLGAATAVTKVQAANNVQAPNKAQASHTVDTDLGSTDAEKVAKQRAIKQAENQIQKPTPKRKPVVVPIDKNALPNACDLVSADFVSKTLGMVAARDIYVKDGSGKKAVSARSCFFKWDDGGNPNAGVLVQIQKNPLPDEFPDWASYFIRAKRDQGDKMPDGSGTYRYKDFPGMGVAGAYNYDLARYTWRTDTGNVFMVAFNLQSSEAEQLIWAEKIGKEAMRNFSKTKN